MATMPAMPYIRTWASANRVLFMGTQGDGGQKATKHLSPRFFGGAFQRISTKVK